MKHNKAKSSKPSALPIRRCENCGRVKEILFHYQQCLINQTVDIIQKVNDTLARDKDVAKTIQDLPKDFLKKKLTWEQLLVFDDLRKKGMDQCGIDLCKRSFFHYEQKHSFEDRVTLLNNIIAVLYIYNLNSKLPMPASDGKCIICEKHLDECLKERSFHYDQFLLDILLVEKEDEKYNAYIKKIINTKVRVLQFGYTLLYYLITVIVKNYSRNPDQDIKSQYATAVQVFELYKSFVEQSEMGRLIAQCDAAIGF